MPMTREWTQRMLRYEEEADIEAGWMTGIIVES